MTAYPAEARLTVDLDALAANYHRLVEEARGAEVAPTVKADAYGLGAGPVARRLWAEGARAFFVARLSEGEALRAALGPRSAEILVLDGTWPGTADRFEAADLTPVLGTLEQAHAWMAGSSAPAGLHVDTGMNRLGVSLDEALDLARRGPRITLVMSHLGDASAPDHPRNAGQRARFLPARAAFAGARASLAASSGIFLGPDYHFDMVRPGISLYGGGPLERPDPRIRAVATLDLPILQIRELSPGDTVGYGSMFTADRPIRAGVLGGGYADGVIRASHAAGAGWIGAARAPFLIVSMDLIVVDLQESPDARVGDRVEVLGPNAHLDDLARAASSVAHEILVRLSSRAERRYIGAVA